jgi:serine/threonine protein kinase
VQPTEELSSLTRDDPTAFAPPPAFGPFRVLHQVGVGALGPVFRTYEPTRDRLVAVKVFRLDITPEQAQSLADELAVATEAGLFHPSIVEPIASGVEGSVAYRAEEYVAAESLDVAMRHYAPATMDKVLPFISQLAAAVDFARLAGIGHGALHPRDIFVTPEEARATGFGIVEALERVGLRAPVRRPYAAPERVAGAPWSTQADVFSLGAITYELLTGRRPAGVGRGIGDLQGASAGRHADVVLDALVRAMEEDPSARFPTAMAFASALESASRGEAVAAAQVPVVAPVVAKAQPAPPAATPKPPEPQAIDDISSERDEDDAHFVLTQSEREAEFAYEPAEALDLFDTEAIEDLAMEQPPEPERFADDFNFVPLADEPEEIEPKVHPRSETPAEPPAHPRSETPAEPPAVSLEPEPDDEPELIPDVIKEPEPVATSYRAGSLSYADPDVDPDPEPAMVPPRRSIDYVPDETYAPQPPRAVSRGASLFFGIVIGALVGFGAGFGAGYGLGTRSKTPSQAEANAAQQPAADAAGKAESGKAYSEGTVGPAAPKQPEQAPPVPADAPAQPTAGGTSPAPTPGKPATPPAATTGRITIRSVPANAAVTLDGTWRGRTPLTLEKLTLGTHEVRVVQAGFAVARETVSLTQQAPARTVSLRLQRTGAAPQAPSGRTAPPSPSAPSERSTPAPSGGLPPISPAPRGPGSLYVDSRPRGAAIFMDGKRVGVTPATIPDVPAGPHVIRLELPDHRVWTANSQVLGGQQTRVTGSLERIR